MKTKLWKYFLLIGLIGVLADVAPAQTIEQVDKVRVELERTNEIIERAKEAVKSSNAPVAALALKDAIDLQQQAKGLFVSGRLLLAYKVTLKARERAKAALVRSRLAEEGETVVLRKLERAAELLERAKESAPPEPDRRLRATYEVAKNNLNRAWEFYRSQDYRPALKLTYQVIKAAREILNATNRLIRRYAEFERLSESVSELITEVQGKVAECNSQEASRLLDRADKMFRRSRKLASEGKLDAAVRSLQKARKLSVKASKRCNGSEGLRQRYDRIKSEADRVAEEIAPDNDPAKQLLKQVYEQLHLAENYIKRQQTEAAAASLKAANLTLNELKKHLSRDSG